MTETKRLLVTGATGKVGQVLLKRFLSSERFAEWKIRAFCHHREPEPDDRMEVMFGSMENQADVEKAVAGVTHVLHLADG